jgi:hypothetical protein
MMYLTPRLEAFVKLGDFLSDYCEYKKDSTDGTKKDGRWYQRFDDALHKAHQQNKWFTEDNVLHAFGQWSKLLTDSKLSKWLAAYSFGKNPKKNIALVMAGNIPLVGFHDMLCVLVTGHSALVKLSSNDAVLIPLLVSFLSDVDGDFKNAVTFTQEKLQDFDAVIATGSNNTARYFEYYFGQKPHIIRKNRNSIAILHGKETAEELKPIGEDIFRYFGLGCRSVSKLYVPKGYDFDIFFKSIYPYKYLIQNHKYANNYDYNKAVYLMSEFKILDNGFLILKEDSAYASPIASLFYEYYDSKEVLQKTLHENRENIQCIVATDFMENEIPFGQTQKPSLSDYADGVDTVAFLLNLD